MRRILLLSLLFSAWSALAQQTIIRDAKIQTMDNTNSWAEALCIDFGVITFVGSNKDAAKCFSEDEKPQIISANGRTILPGLIDSHMHIFGGSSSATKINLSLAEDLDSLINSLKVLASEATQDVVYARGWQNHIFDSQGPRKTLLDEIFGERKVILGSVDGHSTWFSSAALRAAGVDKSIIDPEPGITFWERDKKTGELLGTSREGAGYVVTSKLINRDKSYYRAAFKKWLDQANRSGLTTVFDAGMSAPTEEEAWQILNELASDNSLTLRVYGVAQQRGNSPEQLIENYRHYTKNYQSEYVNPTAVKLLADGVPEAHTAFMVDDYADRPGERGSPMTSPEQLTAYVKAANSNGIAVHIHAIGDAAIDMSLTAIAEAGNSELGWQNAIAHMDFVRPEDIARLKTLQVTAQKSIQWATVDPSYYGIGKFVGMETMERAYPAKSILEAGGNLSLGSDWPSAAYLSTFKPFTLIEIAQTRRLPGYTEGPVRGESERISLMQSLYAITMGSARQLGIADKVGSLEVGKRADLIMLAKDIFTQPSNQINTNYSVLTMLDGKVVYQGE